MTTVTLRRTEAGQQEIEVDKRAAAIQVAAEQLRDFRIDLVDTVYRFGRGGHLWAERGWGWEDPDWTASPETWPPVAKLCWLWSRILTLQSAIAGLRHLAKHPLWCDACRGDEPFPGSPWMKWQCPDHGFVKEGVLCVARDMGLIE